MKILLILLFFLESLSSKKLAILKKNHKFSVALHKDESSIHRWLLDNDDNNPCMATVKIASNTAKYFDKSDLKFKDMLMGNQDFKMSFETGSPITWITANDCLTCQRLGFNNGIQIPKEEIPEKDPLIFTYHNGFDEIDLEHYWKKSFVQIDDIIAKEQQFGVVIKMKENDFKKLNFKADGVVGLGLEQNKDSQKQEKILDHIFTQEKLKSIFSFYLKPKHEENSNKIPNHLTIGNFDSNLIEKNQKLVYCNVIEGAIDWALKLNSISLEGGKNKDGKNVQEDVFNDDKRGRASIRSEKKSIILQKSIWTKILKSLNDNGRECSELEDLHLMKCKDTILSNYPNIVFDLCGNKVVLNPIDYIEVQDKSALLQFQSYDGENKLISCILGNTFMRKYYTVFNLYAKNIGFALATIGPIDMSGWKKNSNIRLVYLFSIGLFILLTMML